MANKSRRPIIQIPDTDAGDSNDPYINTSTWIHWPVGRPEAMVFKAGDVFVSPSDLPNQVFEDAKKDKFIMKRSHIEGNASLEQQIAEETKRMEQLVSGVLDTQNDMLQKATEIALSNDGRVTNQA